MSGHSKWAQIKRQKGATDQKRGALFTKLGNAITLMAREKGGNPESNFGLRLAIDKAKAANLPKDNIERAIKRGTGEVADERIEEIVYEGFGPHKVALIVEVLTDNKNRAASVIKHLFNKYDGNLSGPNSVKWMFEPKGLIKIGIIPEKIQEEIELKIIDAGAEDIKNNKDGLTVYTNPQKLQKVKENLEKENIPIEYAEIEWVAKEKIKIDDEVTRTKLKKFFAELDESEEINNFYTNIES